MVGQVNDDIEILLGVGIIECLQRTTGAFQRLLGCGNASRPALLQLPPLSFRGIGAVKQIFPHAAPPCLCKASSLKLAGKA